MELKLEIVKINKPAELNIIIGQTHFIKSIEDIYEALVSSVPNIKFGIAFCEASGATLVRSEGSDEELKKIAIDNALAIGAGHSFVIIIKDAYPINVLNQLKMVGEVCRIFCATANPLEVIVAQTEQGRGILGVIDGFSPKGVEKEEDIKWRKEFLRKIKYKL
ncbi:MAG: adenosine-specific kinase [Candidatus Omnitrophica bacterium]|nr:adenosine-specific kinase [Candidatus Omnitrophota bacterium]